MAGVSGVAVTGVDDEAAAAQRRRPPVGEPVDVEVDGVDGRAGHVDVELDGRAGLGLDRRVRAWSRVSGAVGVGRRPVPPATAPAAPTAATAGGRRVAPTAR